MWFFKGNLLLCFSYKNSCRMVKSSSNSTKQVAKWPQHPWHYYAFSFTPPNHIKLSLLLLPLKYNFQNSSFMPENTEIHQNVCTVVYKSHSETHILSSQLLNFQGAGATLPKNIKISIWCPKYTKLCRNVENRHKNLV